MVVVANHLPLRAIPEPSGGHRFEWDEDSLIGQAKVIAPGRAVMMRAALHSIDPSMLSEDSSSSTLCLQGASTRYIITKETFYGRLCCRRGSIRR